MENNDNISNLKVDSPAIYRIRIQGRLHTDWSRRLANLQITYSTNNKFENETLLVGRLEDQAALNGILTTLYNSNFPVISVECLEKL